MPRTAFRQQHFTRAASFLDRLRGSRWPAEELGTSWLFRGQARAHKWKLLPAAYRDDRRSERQAILRSAYERAEREACGDWFTWAGMAEPPSGHSPRRWQHHVNAAAPEAFAHAFAVRRFVLLADRGKQRIKVPAALWHLPNPKQSYLAEFLKGRSAEQRNGKRVMSAVFSIAQHHGIATPLLDWTYNPLVAAYFAAEQTLCAATTEPLVVWALSEDYLNDERAQLERLTVEPHVSPFIDAQEGLFTWHPDAYSAFRTGAFTPFDEVIRQDLAQIQARAVLLWRLTLAGSEANRLFNLLWHEGVGRAYLMPGFDSVTASLSMLSRWANSGLDRE